MYYEMETGEDGSAPAAGRPAPLMEVLPQAGLGRHGGIGFELVLSNTVPQLKGEEDVTDRGPAEKFLPVFLKRVKEKEKRREKEKAMTRKVTAQEIPEVQGGAPSRMITPQERNSKRIAGQEPQAIPQERISEGIGEKVPRVIPPRRISERIQKQIVDAPEQSTSQMQTSERIQEQTVKVPGMRSIPQKRFTNRIVEQKVDDSVMHDIPQERISERIEGRIGGNPSTSSSAAATLNSAEWLGDRCFRTFSPAEKSATSTRQSSANMLSHSSSWTPAPYQEEELPLEVDEWYEAFLTRHPGPDWRDRTRRGEFG